MSVYIWSPTPENPKGQAAPRGAASPVPPVAGEGPEPVTSGTQAGGAGANILRAHERPISGGKESSHLGLPWSPGILPWIISHM